MGRPMITVRCSESLRRDVSDLAWRRRMSANSLCVEALQEVVNRERLPLQSPLETGESGSAFEGDSSGVVSPSGTQTGGGGTYLKSSSRRRANVPKGNVEPSCSER